MSREEVRTVLSMISGNTTEKIQFGFPMKTWSPSENEDVDGRLIHAWILEHLNEGESFKSHDGSLSLERFKHDVVGHFDCGKGIWVFTFGRIQYYRKPRAFARVGWKDLTRDKIGNNLTRGLPEYEGLDYLAVFPTIDCSNPQWVLVEGPINTIGLPTHQPLALRFLHAKITQWIRSYDSSALARIMALKDEYYGEALGEVSWLSSIFERPLRADKTNGIASTKFDTDTYDRQAMREIWMEFSKVTVRDNFDTVLSEAVYENIVTQFQTLTALGRRLFGVRKRSERRVFPIVRTDERANVNHFVLVDRETKFVMLDGKFNIPTAPLAAGMDHDLIGISTFESAIQHGIQNYTDSLGPRIRLRTSYFQSTLNPDRVIKLDWSNLIVCEKTVEGNSRELILNNSFQTTIDGEVVRGTHFGCVNIEFGSIRIDGSGFKKNGEDYEFVGYDLDFERVG
jgi:hypothetical protein